VISTNTIVLGSKTTARLDDGERITQVGKYANRKQRNLFEVLEGYKSVDWEVFKPSLMDLYPNTFKARQYTWQSLDLFTTKAARSEITDEDELNKYYHGFLLIAQWLVTVLVWVSPPHRDLTQASAANIKTRPWHNDTI
jgi:hypothetical protein